MFRDSVASEELLSPAGSPSQETLNALEEIGFEDLAAAVDRLQTLCDSEAERFLFAKVLPTLLHALNNAVTPDGSLLNFQRFVETVENKERLFEMLSQQPRAVEILVKLFVGSQFLTEILLRNPHYLDRLTEHKRLAEFKSRTDFVEQCQLEIPHEAPLLDVMNQLRRFQQWELLRLAACDTFFLMDLKTVTLQLSLLAEGIVQVSLERVAELEGISLDDFAVFAFGKLGGEELNYSSDIDLVFVCKSQAENYWGLSQKLIKTLSETTDLGFLYRVDMRLRPWGNAGALVSTADAYVDYMQKQGHPWEKQALLKARPIAGNREIGQQTLNRLKSFVFEVQPEAARQNIREMKQKIEKQLERKRRVWGEVKGGPGGIRDIEFVTQFLQLIHGGQQPEILSPNTLDSLIRLSDYNLILPDEYRCLTGGYLFLRTIEHALQLMHNQQEHQLPSNQRSLAYLAGRLDYPNADTFQQQFERHTRSVREVFERYLHHEQHPTRNDSDASELVDLHFGKAAESYHEIFSPEVAQQHLQLLNELDSTHLVRIMVEPTFEDQQRVTFVGVDQIGELSAVCGLLFANGFDIVSGHVFTGADVETMGRSSAGAVSSRRTLRLASKEIQRQRKFVNVFYVRRTSAVSIEEESRQWVRFERELNELLMEAKVTGFRHTQGRLAHRVAAALEESRPATSSLLPIEIDVVEATDSEATILNILSEDVPGFLYELTNAIAVSGLSIQRMTIQSVGNRVIDTLHVVDRNHRGLQESGRLNELRAAIVLIKHFTHLLPHSPNPESALIHFQEFVENLFQQSNWLEQLSPLHDSEVLRALATLLGISDFLWDDFLRLQHENLFPVVTNVEGLQRARGRESLEIELRTLLESAETQHSRIAALNAFKDREMMRADMRHLLGLQEKFGMFGRELTDVVEVVVAAACRLCEEDLTRRHGVPLQPDGKPVSMSICALGKCGGQELGYASDIELMFVYECEGSTAGPKVISNTDYYEKLVHQFRKMIRCKRKGIFEIDLRLRPFGNAGSLAVSLESFEKYFAPAGAAWPFERQALVKLRPIAGSKEFGRRLVELRDRMIYRGEPFEVGAMRAMREKQIRQLVRAGTFNAKLSPGGLVDCEYLVQGLQITFGHLDAAIREPHTREAMKALEWHGLLTGELRVRLRDAYRFWRRVIDALRVVRGDASDLTVPAIESDEFGFLAKRLNYGAQTAKLQEDLERHTQNVLEMTLNFEHLLQQKPSQS